MVFCAGSAAAQPPPSVPQSERIGDYKDLSKEQKAMLDDLEKRTFEWFRDSENPKIGITPDHWDGAAGGEGDFFASIASSGFGLTAYGIGAERGWMKRAKRCSARSTTLRFFHGAPQGDAPTPPAITASSITSSTCRPAAATVRRLGGTLDHRHALLLGGVLFAQSYYDQNTKDENEIRQLADEIYRRVDWPWTHARPPLVAMGWTPEANFIHARLAGLRRGDAALRARARIADACGRIRRRGRRGRKPTTRRGAASRARNISGFAPMFGHQYSHVWIDFRGIQDDYMRSHGIDYFENSQRAALSQRAYAIHNPMDWKATASNVWGLTACNGPRRGLRPGEIDRYKNDKKRSTATSHAARVSCATIDDGTIAPTAAAVVDAVRARNRDSGHRGNEQTVRATDLYDKYGFVDAFNPSFTLPTCRCRPATWCRTSAGSRPCYIGIDQGPIIAMIENYRNDFVWKAMRKNPYIRDGLKRAGFTGGWLDQPVDARDE